VVEQLASMTLHVQAQPEDLVVAQPEHIQVQ
jgi:hypothetical protein